MAGHSHAKNVMHRKEAQNKKRSKVLSKIAHAITVAVKLGGRDSDSNPKLRLALKQAQSASMSKDAITRAIDSAQKKNTDAEVEEIIYEGYFYGVAIMVETLTANRHKTAPEIKAIVSKYGGTIDQPNTVSFLFDKFACIDCTIEKPQLEDFFAYAVDLGALDILEHEIEDKESSDKENSELDISALFPPDKLHLAQEKLETWKITNAQICYIPKTFTSLNEEKREKFFKMLEILEENESTQTCWHNYKE